MTKKKPILDPEWTPLAELGDIKSKVNLELDRATQIIARLQADGERQESRVIKRGVLEIRARSNSFVASFEPEARTVEINGRTIPNRPTQLKGEGAIPGEALMMLVNELVASGTLGQ